MLEKKTILQVENVYTTHAFETSSGMYVAAGSETGPEVYLFDLANGHKSLVSDCPGGMMSFIPVPGLAHSYISIMGLFPPFIGKEAGLYGHHHSVDGWETRKIIDLPFAHRCEIMRVKDENILVAATVSKHKENPADWSQKGGLHLFRIGEDIWNPEPMDPPDLAIFRNHGMLKTRNKGMERLYVSGVEGLFEIVPREDGSWHSISVLEKEVSEFTFIDLNGDGTDELVTIEPFHGNTLNIYQQQAGGWVLRSTDSLSFGHGLSSGFYHGLPVIVAGNRSDSLTLDIFTVGNLVKGTVYRRVIEEEAGPTQTQVLRHNGVDYILSSNQKKNEVALYAGVLE